MFQEIVAFTLSYKIIQPPFESDLLIQETIAIHSDDNTHVCNNSMLCLPQLRERYITYTLAIISVKIVKLFSFVKSAVGGEWELQT